MSRHERLPPVFPLRVRPTLTGRDFPKRSPCCGDAVYPIPGRPLGWCGFCDGPVQPLNAPHTPRGTVAR